MAKNRLLKISGTSSGIVENPAYNLSVLQVFNNVTLPWLGRYMFGKIYGITKAKIGATSFFVPAVEYIKTSTDASLKLSYNICVKMNKDTLETEAEFTGNSDGAPYDLYCTSQDIIYPYSTTETKVMNKDTLTIKRALHTPERTYANTRLGVTETHIFYPPDTNTMRKVNISDSNDYSTYNCAGSPQEVFISPDGVVVYNGSFTKVDKDMFTYITHVNNVTCRTHNAHYHPIYKNFLVSDGIYLFKLALATQQSGTIMMTSKLSLAITVQDAQGGVNFSVFGDDIYCLVNKNTIIKMDYKTLVCKASIQVGFDIDPLYRLIALEDGVLCYSSELNSTIKIG